MTPPSLVSLQVGLPQTYGNEAAADPMDRSWTSGFIKQRVQGAVMVRTINLDGDGQADLVNHGGPDKAVCAYSADHYEYWRTTLERPSLPFGAFGENFTIAGLVETEVCIGDVWQVGEVVVQVTQPRQPCWKLARRWRVKDLADRVVKNGKSGWYFRVLTEGPVENGLPFTLIDRPFPSVSVARVNRAIFHEKSNLAQFAELAAVPPIAGTLRRWFEKRLEQARA